MNRRGDFDEFRLTDQPDFVQAPDVAGGYADPVDLLDAGLAARRVPCICPAQDDGAVARCIGVSRSRGLAVEQVACERCPRTWRRINC